ncbi:hypothetical protein Pmar_PMAR025003 [Perkinsus marinus ATCC 50983]|uniref:Uncharacterized protein n=1 Tax=Perkinsus marinus (strain ATCC 50983 / TXsc) TaxID=423536 RepID=C5LMF4_PERM5|nr:hypothetical protein Pmar_PMAR025003 [Perkinsus marinus ATCC 50983]EER02090.1 hypothetical protein Pmar_PMAR025003 [Perkinsus marinus ATCC 50983]|eukprot:XP_002769372.1 hypothetical protein Pmar_PMAR025003 [Perkinsus marinus ATCC 50983]
MIAQFGSHLRHQLDVSRIVDDQRLMAEVRPSLSGMEIAQKLNQANRHIAFGQNNSDDFGAYGAEMLYNSLKSTRFSPALDCRFVQS